jgi:SAM-dependent methyltransferase
MKSQSEENGLNAIQDAHQRIYSVGISTGAAAEMRMALSSKDRRIIATTIDVEGALFAQEKIAKAGLSKQIDVKIEDIAKPLAYPEEHFDFVYARLVLHYLSAQDLSAALAELNRILKWGGKLFIVVRSHLCVEAQDSNVSPDPETKMTTYSSHGRTYSRYFHSEESIQEYVKSAGFCIQHIDTYFERLCVDFKRTQLSPHEDSLIEVLAYK